MNDMEIEASNLRLLIKKSINRSINPSQYAPAAWRRPPRAPLGYYHPDSTDEPSPDRFTSLVERAERIPCRHCCCRCPSNLYHSWFDECITNGLGWNVRGKYVVWTSILARNYVTTASVGTTFDVSRIGLRFRGSTTAQRLPCAPESMRSQSAHQDEGGSWPLVRSFGSPRPRPLPRDSVLIGTDSCWRTLAPAATELETPKHPIGASWKSTERNSTIPFNRFVFFGTFMPLKLTQQDCTLHLLFPQSII